MIAATRAGWIPVSDELPDDECMVLIALGPEANEPVWIGYHCDNQWFESDHFPVDADVTHWQHFPEHPAAVTEGSGS